MNQIVVLALLYVLSVAFIQCLKLSEPQYLHLKSGTEADDVSALPISPLAVTRSSAHFCQPQGSVHILARPEMSKSGHPWGQPSPNDMQDLENKRPPPLPSSRTTARNRFHTLSQGSPAGLTLGCLCGFDKKGKTHNK